MSCRIITCPVDGKHHHHTRAGVVIPTACRCTRPETVERPTTAELLDFAAAHPGKVTGHVDEQLRRELRITPVRYLQLLSQFIHTEEALQHDAQTTYRLRREADHRARTREARNTSR